MISLEERLTKALDQRKLDGNYRALSTQRAEVDFFSNDYLGLSRNKGLQNLIQNAYNSLAEKANGSTGSRLLSGNNPFYVDLEKSLAGIFQGEASLVFNSGYTANLAVFSSIPQKGDTIIYDELIHVCIKEGARLSFADRLSFRHNDLKDLESKLQRAKGEKFIAIESVYSMDGDFAPIEEIVSLSEKYNANLIIDEAHSTGVFGDKGSGLVCERGLMDKFFIRTYTFGKAIGAHGACIVGSETLIQYLINFARSFIYTTALPLHNLVTIDCTFKYLAENLSLQQELYKRISYFRQSLQEAKAVNSSVNFIDSHSAIQAIVVPGNSQAKALAQQLISKGFDVRPILYPTVPEGKERIRICLHVYNTFEKIKSLVEVIKGFKF